MSLNAAQNALYGLIEPCRAVSLVGICKNAGKTTVLNCLLRKAGLRGVTAGLTSVGLDGESVDLVTGTGKPGIWIENGSIVATAEGLLPRCDATREILEATGIFTPMGQVVVFRALSGGAVQIGGPSTVSQLITVAGALRGFGAEKIFIDGALNRKSLCDTSLSDAAILCAGASFGPNMDEVVAETAFFCMLAMLPKTREAVLLDRTKKELTQKAALVGKDVIFLGDEEALNLAAALRDNAANRTRCVFVEGALTDALLLPLATGNLRLSEITLVARSAVKFMARRAVIQKFMARGGKLAVIKAVRLAAVAVNPFSAYGYHFEANLFLRKMAAALPVPVFDVVSGQIGGAV